MTAAIISLVPSFPEPVEKEKALTKFKYLLTNELNITDEYGARYFGILPASEFSIEAARLLYSKRDSAVNRLKQIRIICVLPSQEWAEGQSDAVKEVIRKANKVVYVNGSIMQAVEHLSKNSTYLISYCRNYSCTTADAIRLAYKVKPSLQIFNTAAPPLHVLRH